MELFEKFIWKQWICTRMLVQDVCVYKTVLVSSSCCCSTGSFSFLQQFNSSLLAIQSGQCTFMDTTTKSIVQPARTFITCMQQKAKYTARTTCQLAENGSHWDATYVRPAMCTICSNDCISAAHCSIETNTAGFLLQSHNARSTRRCCLTVVTCHYFFFYVRHMITTRVILADANKNTIHAMIPAIYYHI